MSTLEFKPLYVPLLNIYGRNRYEYESIVCGVFCKKTEALYALIRKLLELEMIVPDSGGYDESICYKGETLKEGDIDFNMQVLSKYANTLDDVKDICRVTGDLEYEERFSFSVNEFPVQ